MIVGIDFDNTVASYDDLMYRHALGDGLIQSSVPRNKKSIRDAIRMLPDGESRWRGLQVYAYGAGMRYAQPMSGVKDFLSRCKVLGTPVWIVSHKTEFANFGDLDVNLRSASLDWMQREGLLDVDRFGIGRERIFFEDSREQKIVRIKTLGITHFIDDLEETFREDTFPQEVGKILFTPHCRDAPRKGWTVCATWAEIGRHLLP